MALPRQFANQSFIGATEQVCLSERQRVQKPFTPCGFGEGLSSPDFFGGKEEIVKNIFFEKVRNLSKVVNKCYVNSKCISFINRCGKWLWITLWIMWKSLSFPHYPQKTQICEQGSGCIVFVDNRFHNPPCDVLRHRVI